MWLWGYEASVDIGSGRVWPRGVLACASYRVLEFEEPLDIEFRITATLDANEADRC